MLNRLQRIAARCARRFVPILLMFAMLSGSIGIPLPTFVAKDRLQPYPCRDNACGCTSAEECWHHCCCHTNREKIAWAHEHGVTPPSFVVEAARQEEGQTEHVCCRHKGCEHCAAKGADSTEHTLPVQNPKRARTLRIKLAVSDLARQCRGIASVWSLVTAALPAAFVPAWSFDDRVVGNVFDRPPLPMQVDLSPPIPPPKLV